MSLTGGGTRGSQRRAPAAGISLTAVAKRQGISLVPIGVALGTIGALALSRILTGLLFEMSPTDPTTFAVVMLFVLAVALAACYLPARRAAGVDPIEALRYE